jgi:hypothetical protein
LKKKSTLVVDDNKEEDDFTMVRRDMPQSFVSQREKDISEDKSSSVTQFP